MTQALIIKDPLSVDEESGVNSEGKLKVLALGYQVYQSLVVGMEDLDAPFHDPQEGIDFIIKKTKQGDFSIYSIGSKFARKATALTEEQITVADDAAVELKSLLPTLPTLEFVQTALDAYRYETNADYEGGPVEVAEKSDDADDIEYTDQAADIIASIRNRKRA